MDVGPLVVFFISIWRVATAARHKTQIAGRLKNLSDYFRFFFRPVFSFESPKGRDSRNAGKDDRLLPKDDPLSPKDDGLSWKDDGLLPEDDELSPKDGHLSLKDDYLWLKDDYPRPKDDGPSLKDGGRLSEDDHLLPPDEQPGAEDDAVKTFARNELRRGFANKGKRRPEKGRDRCGNTIFQ